MYVEHDKNIIAYFFFFISLFVYTLIYLSIYLFIYLLFIYLNVYLFIHLFTYLFIYLFILGGECRDIFHLCQWGSSRPPHHRKTYSFYQYRGGFPSLQRTCSHWQTTYKNRQQHFQTIRSNVFSIKKTLKLEKQSISQQK